MKPGAGICKPGPDVISSPVDRVREPLLELELKCNGFGQDAPPANRSRPSVLPEQERGAGRPRTAGVKMFSVRASESSVA